jgi:hypothetical protein
MITLGFQEFKVDTAFPEQLRELPGILNQAIILAARDPEQFEFLVRCSRIF